MSKYIVGVSGGIGSGKTTVTDMFVKKGIEVIDADIIARHVVAKGTQGLSAIVEKFGIDILTQQGELNRTKLREIIFADKVEKEWLNSLLHPLIRDKMLIDTQQAKSEYCLLSAPLLIENKLYTQVDRVLIVDVSEKTQLQRGMRRDNNSKQQIKRIMQAQASRSERLQLADDVINNNGDKHQLKPQVERLHQQYMTLAGSV